MKDDVLPDGKWKFNEEVTDCFDDMLERSIPDYNGMRSAVLEVGRRFVRPGTSIVDAGASRGSGLAPFVEEWNGKCSFYGIEVSGPMGDAFEARFGSSAKLFRRDLREGIPNLGSSLTLFVLTMCFVPIEHRLSLLRSAFLGTVPGGAIIVVEKVIGRTAETDAVLVGAHLDGKRRAGYTEEQIARKRLSLEGVLVPVTAAWNEDLIASAGFTSIECFWRRLNFAAWFGVRP